MKLSEIVKQSTENTPKRKSRQQQIHEKTIRICQAMEKNRKLCAEFEGTDKIVEKYFPDIFFYNTDGRNDVRRKRIVMVLDNERLKCNPILKTNGTTHIESMQPIPKKLWDYPISKFTTTA